MRQIDRDSRPLQELAQTSIEAKTFSTPYGVIARFRRAEEQHDTTISSVLIDAKRGLVIIAKSSDENIQEAFVEQAAQNIANGLRATGNFTQSINSVYQKYPLVDVAVVDLQSQAAFGAAEDVITMGDITIMGTDRSEIAEIRQVTQRALREVAHADTVLAVQDRFDAVRDAVQDAYREMGKEDGGAAIIVLQQRDENYDAVRQARLAEIAALSEDNKDITPASPVVSPVRHRRPTSIAISAPEAPLLLSAPPEEPIIPARDETEFPTIVLPPQGGWEQLNREPAREFAHGSAVLSFTRTTLHAPKPADLDVLPQPEPIQAERPFNRRWEEATSAGYVEQQFLQGSAVGKVEAWDKREKHLGTLPVVQVEQPDNSKLGQVNAETLQLSTELDAKEIRSDFFGETYASQKVLQRIKKLLLGTRGTLRNAGITNEQDIQQISRAVVLSELYEALENAILMNPQFSVYRSIVDDYVRARRQQLQIVENFVEAMSKAK